MVLSGAEILIEELVKHGVDTVFGYPGGSVLNIYDELYKNAHRVSHILSAHEQGAAHAADAYARVSGKPGVVVATSGPGATNLVTGIANAYLDSVPVVFITGNVAVPMLGRDSFQEIDIIGVTLPIVKHSYVVRDIKDLQKALSEAFLIAMSDRKGPVLVDIPKNIQTDTCEYDPGLKITLKSGESLPSDLSRFDEAIAAIEKSKRPYIYCGGGVTASDCGEYIMQLSQKLRAPVGASIMGIGSVPYSYERYLGMSGMHGRYAANIAQSEADLIIALGVRFSDRATGSTKEYSKHCQVLHVDIDPAELGKNIGPDISLCGSLKVILPRLILESRVNPSEEWEARIRDLKAAGSVWPTEEFTPRNIIHRVNTFYDNETVVATDVGQHQMWVAQYYAFEKPRKLVTSGGLGAMGFGLGAAVGASVARGAKRAVLFTSEGSFGMNLNELATAVSQHLPVTIILLNNGVLGMVRQWQSLFFDERYSQTTLNRKTDFPALAKAFGALGYAANTLSELDDILKSVPDDAGPCLIDCKIDEDERVLPMIPAGGTIRDMLIN